MRRCEEGHFYDPAKHSACPWCAKPLDLVQAQRPVVAEGKTRPVRSLEGNLGQTPAPMANAAAIGVTRRLDSQPTGVSPVVGWLVCIDGPEKGRDYRLHSEKNFIGRSPAMDVCLGADDSVSREKHAAVVYEPKRRAFWIMPGDASGIVYLNQEMVHAPVVMKQDDVIELGKTKLVLASFTSEKAGW